MASTPNTAESFVPEPDALNMPPLASVLPQMSFVCARVKLHINGRIGNLTKGRRHSKVNLVPAGRSRLQMNIVWYEKCDPGSATNIQDTYRCKPKKVHVRSHVLLARA